MFKLVVVRNGNATALQTTLLLKETMLTLSRPRSKSTGDLGTVPAPAQSNGIGGFNVELLGKGGFAQVYKFRDSNDAHYYAMKYIRIESTVDMKMAKREVDIQLRLDHPGVVRYYGCYLPDSGIEPAQLSGDRESSVDYEESDLDDLDNYYDNFPLSQCLRVKMELCEITLEKWMEKSREKSNEWQLRSTYGQLLSAVEFIHFCGVIHRDLKPANIFFAVKPKGKDPGVLKIGDFGLSKISTGASYSTISNGPLTRPVHRPSIAAGTAPYCSPEQLRGQPCTDKSDIFALGVIYLELFGKMRTRQELIETMHTFPLQELTARTLDMESSRRFDIKQVIKLCKEIPTFHFLTSAQRNRLKTKAGKRQRVRSSQK